MTEERNPDLDLALIREAEASARKYDMESSKLASEIRAMSRFQEKEEAKEENHFIYSFWQEVTNSSARACVDQLGKWSRAHPGEPFTIVFNSPGGGVLPGLALFDYIRELRTDGHDITTVSLGYAASMGGILLQAGSKRILGKHSWLMIHEIGSTAFGKMTELEDEVKFVKRLQDQCLDILAERSTLSKAQITTRWKRKDWWLNAEEALDGGFVDEIRT